MEGEGLVLTVKRAGRLSTLKGQVVCAGDRGKRPKALHKALSLCNVTQRYHKAN